MAKPSPKDFIAALDESGFQFNSEASADDAELYEQFRTAITQDVGKTLTQYSPYALAILCGDLSTHIAIIKRKMGLSGGGAAVQSYGMYETKLYSIDDLVEGVSPDDEVVILDPVQLKSAVQKMYENKDDVAGIDELIKKYINLLSPTFETQGNELFADDAENVSERIFEDHYDPIVSPIFKINEDDLIFTDLYSSGNGELKDYAPGHVRYETERGRCLDIINVNRKEGEKALGVDLIYYNKEFRSIVMVQYKRIDSGVYYTNSDQNYQKEIDRMTSSAHLFEIPSKYEPKVEHKLFRLSDCPYYFKMCPEVTYTKNKYVSGACIPLNHWQSLMKSERCQTRAGNTKLDYEGLEGRYLRATEFIELTKRGMLGGYISGLDKLAELIIELKNLDHTIVASIESPHKDYTDI